jgi:hypothetical protein
MRTTINPFKETKRVSEGGDVIEVTWSGLEVRTRRVARDRRVM